MYKIKYLKTGNVFILPQVEAEKLKNKEPDDYLILEKNGKKFRDKIKPKIKRYDNKSILSKVLDTSAGENK